jgi:hypothetical protein
VLLFGCGASGCGASGPAAPAIPLVGERIEVAEGTPVRLGDGTTLAVDDVAYAHGPDSRDLSSCTMIVRRGKDLGQIVLAREHGGSDPESSTTALGWKITLEVADPYRRPPRIVVVVRKL